jgi:hypothetical protein
VLYADMIKLWKKNTRVEYKTDSIMKRIIITPNAEDTTESSAIRDEEDPKGVVPLSSDSK